MSFLLRRTQFLEARPCWYGPGHIWGLFMIMDQRDQTSTRAEVVKEGRGRERGREEEEWKADDKRKTGINHSGCLTKMNNKD